MSGHKPGNPLGYSAACKTAWQDAHNGNGNTLPDFLAAFDRAIAEASKS